jgi:O-antigen ligase
MTADRWATLVLPWFREERRFRVLEWTVPVFLAVLVIRAPLPSFALLALTALFALLWRRPGAVVPILIVLMMNAKVNVYAGFFTFFPEYAVFALAGLVLALRWAEEPRPLEERGLVALFAAWILAGVLSVLNAPMIGQVLAKAGVLVLAALTCWLVVGGVRSERELGRALAWWQGAALISILYGILQMTGLLLGFDTSLGFLQKYGNHDMYYSIGAPAELSFNWFFRVNAFFSDPNILAGYLAATGAMTLALWLFHARSAGRRKGRARFEALLFCLGLLCAFLTLSRSGMLGLVAGCGTVLVFESRVLRGGRFWLVGGSGLVLVGLLSSVMGINPLLLVQRLTETFSASDASTRIHHDVFFYGLSLLARYPLTGVGLGNFGAYYGPEVNAYYPNMMSHSAPVSYFAESGLLGGGAFLAVLGVVLWRPWRALRNPSLRRQRPELHAFLVGLLGAVVAIDVANLFYDYYLRTFIWVVSGLALAAARLAERPDVPDGATASEAAMPAHGGI